MKTAIRILGGLMLLAVIGLVFLQPDDPATPTTAPQNRVPAGRTLGGATKPGEIQVLVGEPSVPTLSPAVRDLPPYEPDFPLLDREMAPRDDHGFVGPNVQMPPHDNPLAELQRNAPPPSINDFDTPIVNVAGYTSGSSPPDDTGDVGPNYYLQGDNAGGGSIITIYDKSGSQQTQFLLESLASGAPCSNGYCDPIVQYDELAGRWMISEFDTSVDNLCVYVSQTPDPMGAWYAYSFNPAGGDQDYPKYGVWPDGYYVGVNNGGYVHVLERQAMLNGLPATYQSFNIGTLPGWGFQLTLPATHEGPDAPPADSPGLFLRPVDTEIHSGYSCSPEPCDVMEVWELDVDWGTPANSTLTHLADVQIAEYDHTLCGTSGNWNCMPQPGTTQRIDPIREPLHFPLQYRTWGSYETLVGCYVEDVDGTDHTGVHWFEMRDEGSGWYMYQEGVLGGEAGVHRGVCSAAMDGSGNIAVGYTRTGNSAPYYPSIYYAGRLSTDPLGTMPYYEYVIWNATNSKTNNERWGDYAGIGVDPADDCTFWFTTEYGCCGYTRIAAFKFDQCGTPDFTLDATPDVLGVCAATDAVYDVDVGQQNGFSDAVTLSTSGRPAGTTESFSVNPVTPPGASVLTIGNTGAATPGTYNIDVIGTAPGPVVHQDTVVLNLYAAAPAAPVLVTPADGATGVSLTPTFDWDDVAEATTYEIEIATDPNFATIVDSAAGLTDSDYTPGSPLGADTIYYWRVRADNPCGTGSDSATWAFRTEAIGCTTYVSSDVPRRIPLSGTSGTTTSVLNVAAGSTIDDINVLNLNGTHTYMGDLDFYLDSPTGTRVQLMEQACGSDEDFDLNLDDEAPPGPWPCPPTDGGTYQPTGSLSDFDGQDSTGTWTLTIVDNYSGDTGQLDGWSLEICGGSAPVPADYSDLDSGYGIAWHTGDGSLRLGATWDADTTFADGDDDASDDGVSFIGDLEPGQQVTVRVNVQGTPVSGRWLRLWFDWDGDGVFDELADGELVYDGAVSDGDNDIVVDVPGSLAEAACCRARLYDSAAAPAGILAQDPNSYGGATGGEVEDGLSPDPVAVELARFEAWPDGPAIHVEWETVTEFDNLGFNLYRSDAAAGAYVQLNDDLIPSQAPGSPVGAVYAWRDEGVAPGATYYYRLEDVDVYGAATLHGPLPVTMPAAKHIIYLPLVTKE